MVEDHDLEGRQRRLRECPLRRLQLPGPNAATSEGVVEGSVDADQQHLSAAQRRFQVATEVFSVGSERAGETLPKPVQRHIVIAGDDENRNLDPLHEPPCRLKLRGLGALGEVARDDDEIGAAGGNQVENAGGTIPLMRWTEVDIGDVQKGLQGFERATFRADVSEQREDRAGQPDRYFLLWIAVEEFVDETGDLVDGRFRKGGHDRLTAATTDEVATQSGDRQRP